MSAHRNLLEAVESNGGRRAPFNYHTIRAAFSLAIMASECQPISSQTFAMSSAANSCQKIFYRSRACGGSFNYHTIKDCGFAGIGTLLILASPQKRQVS